MLPSGRDKTKHCLLVLDRRYAKTLEKTVVPFENLEMSLHKFLKRKLLPVDNDGKLYSKGNYAEVFVQNLIPKEEPRLEMLEYVGLFYSLKGQIKYFFSCGK